jgi:integrase
MLDCAIAGGRHMPDGPLIPRLISRLADDRAAGRLAAVVQARRDLPPEIMRQVCGQLGTLTAPHIRTAIEVLIDTGRRPEDVVALPLDCLAREANGSPVLVYDNHKASRLKRRLPIPAATAAAIRTQQQRVRDRFPGTPAGKLKLLPTGWANRDGRRPLTVAAL